MKNRISSYFMKKLGVISSMGYFPMLCMLASIVLASSGPPIFGHIINMNVNDYLAIHSFVGQFLLLGGFCLFVVFVLKGGSIVTYYEECRRICGHGAIAFNSFVYCILQVAFYFLYISAMKMGSVAEASVYARFSVPVIALASPYLFKNDARISNWRLFIFSMILCISGVFFLNDASLSRIFGLITVVGGMLVLVSSAISLVKRRLTGNAYTEASDGSRKATGMYGMDNGFVSSVLMLVAGILYLLVVYSVYGKIQIPRINEMLLLTYIGLFTIVIPTTIEIFLSKVWSGMVKISVLTMLNPIFVAIIAYLFIGERLTLVAYVFGIGLSLLGVYLSSRALTKVS